jgi:DNA-binding response OmpR family regulator
MGGAPSLFRIDARLGQRPRTILLVEDEQSIGSLVTAYLERDGFSVVWLRTGEEALVELDRHDVRLIVLDIGLPGIDGFEVCRRVRTRSDVPILMLTARDEEADRVVGLEIGADDYVPKPFSPRELVARVKAILRRSEHQDRPALLELGPVQVDREAREARVGDRELELTAKEFDLLAMLIENAGIVLSRERLLEEVWGMAYPGGTRTVDVHVAQLRRKLGIPELIRTVRGAGYKALRM